MNDQYVCINRDGWFNTDNGKRMSGPSFNEIVTFHSLHPRNKLFMCFIEYPASDDDDNWPYDGFNGRHFLPVISDTELYKELESINKTVEV